MDHLGKTETTTFASKKAQVLWRSLNCTAWNLEPANTLHSKPCFGETLIMMCRVIQKHNFTVGCQYPLIMEYTLNNKGIHIMI